MRLDFSPMIRSVFWMISFPTKCVRKLRPLLSSRAVQIFIGIIIGYLIAPLFSIGKPSLKTPPLTKATSKVLFSDSENSPIAAHKLPDAVYNDNDDYEPNLLLSGQKIPPPMQKKVVIPNRPRYYASELGIHEPLFVAVSTTDETILSLATAINKTAAHYLPKLSFFLNSAHPAALPDYGNLSMHVIRSSDTTENLRFMMILKFIVDNHMETFDWFFLAKDTSYLRGKELLEFVKKKSISKPTLLGSNKEYSGKVFCDIEAGILLNQAALRKVAENLGWCIENAGSEDHSVNIGNCFFKATGIQCNEVQSHLNPFRSISVQTSDVDSSDNIQKLILLTPDILNALSFFPLSEPAQYYRLHLELSVKKVDLLEDLIQKTQADIVSQSAFTPSKGADISWPVGVNPPRVPNNRFDVIEWTYFNTTHLFRPDDFTNTQLLVGADLKAVNDMIKSAVDYLYKTYQSDELQFEQLVNGYRKFDPSRGMEYLLDLKFSNAESEMTKRVRILRSLGQMEQVPMPFVTESSRVHLVITVDSSDVQQAVKFIQRYAKTHLRVSDNVFLLIVTIYGPLDASKDQSGDPFAPLRSEAREVDKTYQKSMGTRIGFLVMRKPFHAAPSEFAVMDLLTKKFKKDSLLFRCDIRAILSVELLNRVRLTAIAGWQVFFPIPFAQYKPNIIYKTAPYPEDFDIKRQLGHFDADSYENAAFYLSDYTAARKKVIDYWPIINSDLDLTKEFPRPTAGQMGNRSDPNSSGVLDLYSLFLSTDLHVFRAIEPALKSEFFLLDCDKDQNADERLRSTCQRRLMSSLANKQQLALFFSHHDSSSL